MEISQYGRCNGRSEMCVSRSGWSVLRIRLNPDDGDYNCPTLNITMLELRVKRFPEGAHLISCAVTIGKQIFLPLVGCWIITIAGAM